MVKLLKFDLYQIIIPSNWMFHLAFQSNKWKRTILNDHCDFWLLKFKYFSILPNFSLYT